MRRLLSALLAAVVVAGCGGGEDVAKLEARGAGNRWKEEDKLANLSLETFANAADRRGNLVGEVHIDCFGTCPDDVDGATRARAEAIDAASQAND